MRDQPQYEGADKDKPCYQCFYNRFCPQALMRALICSDYNEISEDSAKKKDKSMKDSKENYWFEKWDNKDYDKEDAETRKRLDEFDKKFGKKKD